jgi:transcriptional regulator with XRE-family HTH domain
MADSFGTRLRLRREEQGIALGVIARDLKIKSSLLEAVERDDVSHWPSGIYRRAFIRAYAQAIGLNPDVVLREFLDLYPDPEEVAAALANASLPAENGSRSGGPPTRLRNLVGSAFGSLSRLGRGTINSNPMAGREAPMVSSPSVPSAPTVVDTLPPPAAAPAPDPVPDENISAVVADEASAPAPPSVAEPSPPPESVERAGEEAPDFLAVAHLCTRLACVADAGELQPLLEEAARILHVSGLIVWLRDDTGQELRPALVHGYSDKVIAQLPTVSRDADNPTAAAFRSAQPRAVRGDDYGALVVPLVHSDGCTGVLAMEFQVEGDRGHTTGVHAAAMIIAAALSQLVGSVRSADVQADPAETFDAPSGPARPLRVRR